MSDTMPRCTPHVIIDSTYSDRGALVRDDDLPCETVLVDGRLIKVGYFALGHEYSLLETSEHPYLLAKGCIDARDGLTMYVGLDGLLVRNAWIEGDKNEGFTYVRLDPYSKSRGFDGLGDYVGIDVLNWMAELPFYVPGVGGIQYRIWLQGELHRATHTVELDVVMAKVIGKWVDDELTPIDRSTYTDAQLDHLHILEKDFMRRQPIAGYRVVASRISNHPPA